jgi:hypothetical protein
VERKLGLRKGRRWTAEEHRARAGHLPEGEEGSDRWGPPVGGRGKKGRTPSGFRPARPWAGSGAGPIRFPRPVSSFFLLFFFFLFLFTISSITSSNLVQIGSN